jgi:hypothetical protein
MTGKLRRLRLLVATVVIMFAGIGWSGAALAATVQSASPAVAPGSCGSVLLAGSAWLGGQGVNVMSNGPDQGTGTSCGGTNTVDGIRTGTEWQCVELVNRLYVTRGWIHATWPGNGGRSSASARNSMYDEAPGALSKQANGSISYVGPGDVVSINVYHNGVFQADGHVLIVNSAGSITSGNVETWYNWGNGDWGGWITIAGATFTSGPQAVATSDGHDQIFANSAGTTRQNWFSPANGDIGDWITV